MSVDGGVRECSLMEKQNQYMSPRKDVLTDLYEEAQSKAYAVKNDKRRNLLIEDTYRKESQKFDVDFARKSWVGSLRNDKCMYMQTTKNSRNALFCNIITSSKDVMPYSTKNAIKFNCHVSELDTEED